MAAAGPSAVSGLDEARRAEITDAFTNGTKLSRRAAWKQIEFDIRHDPQTHDPLGLFDARQAQKKEKRSQDRHLSQAMTRVAQQQKSLRANEFSTYMKEKSGLLQRRNQAQTLGRAMAKTTNTNQDGTDFSLSLGLDRVKHRSKHNAAEKASLFSRKAFDGKGGHREVYELNTYHNEYTRMRGGRRKLVPVVDPYALPSQGSLQPKPAPESLLQNAMKVPPGSEEAPMSATFAYELIKGLLFDDGINTTSAMLRRCRSEPRSGAEKDRLIEWHAAKMDMAESLAGADGDASGKDGDEDVPPGALAPSNSVSSELDEVPAALAAALQRRVGPRALSTKPKSSPALGDVMGSDVAAGIYALDVQMESVRHAREQACMDVQANVWQRIEKSAEEVSIPDFRMAITTQPAKEGPDGKEEEVAVESGEKQMAAVPKKKGSSPLSATGSCTSTTATGSPLDMLSSNSSPVEMSSGATTNVFPSPATAGGNLVLGELVPGAGTVGPFCVTSGIGGSAFVGKKAPSPTTILNKVGAAAERVAEADADDASDTADTLEEPPAIALKRRKAVDHSADGSKARIVAELEAEQAVASSTLERIVPPPLETLKRRGAVDHTADGSQTNVTAKLKQHMEDEDVEEEDEQKVPQKPTAAYLALRRCAVDLSAQGAAEAVAEVLAGSAEAESESDIDEDEGVVDSPEKPPASALRRRRAIDYTADGTKAAVVEELASAVEDDIVDELPAPPAFALRRRTAVDHTADGSQAAILAALPATKDELPAFATRRRLAVDHSGGGMKESIVAQLQAYYAENVGTSDEATSESDAESDEDEGLPTLPPRAMQRRCAVDHTADGSKENLVSRLEEVVEEMEEDAPEELQPLPAFALRRRKAVDNSADGSKEEIVAELAEQQEADTARDFSKPIAGFGKRRRGGVAHPSDGVAAAIAHTLTSQINEEGSTSSCSSADEEDDGETQAGSVAGVKVTASKLAPIQPPAHLMMRRNAVDHASDGTQNKVVSALRKANPELMQDGEKKQLPRVPAFATRRRNAIDYGKHATVFTPAELELYEKFVDSDPKSSGNSELGDGPSLTSSSFGGSALMPPGARVGRRGAVDHTALAETILRLLDRSTAQETSKFIRGRAFRKRTLAPVNPRSTISTLRSMVSQMQSVVKEDTADEKSISTPLVDVTAGERCLRSFLDFLIDRRLTVERIFEICDANHNDNLTRCEFCDAMTHLHYPGGRVQLSTVYALLDADRDGIVARSEFLQLKPYYERRLKGFQL
ncbi:unnamed protein product [Amoebophrya sp. A25]|nr:unnamed protein product [Amoebophrya sp. A25]|eukprot:GSA25T00016240001.1